MKRFFIIAITFLSCAHGFAQWEKVDDPWDDEKKEVVPEQVAIYSWFGNRKLNYAKWYEDQARAWQTVVEKDPKDENAWRNLFYASYCCEFVFYHSPDRPIKKESSKTAVVIRKMKAAIPDTHTFNLCASRLWLDEWGEFDTNILTDAVDSRLSTFDIEETKFFAYELWKVDHDNDLIYNIFRRLHEMQYMDEHPMQYAWNLMLGMQDSAIYVAYREYDYEPMILLQEVFDLRRDITILPYDFIKDKKFCDTMYRRLNIKPYVRDISDTRSRKDFVGDFITYVGRCSGRPLYMSMDAPNYITVNEDSVYNEGLLLKYSNKPYNNIKVALHNIKEVYELGYLTQPEFSHRIGWTSTVDRNVMYCMKNWADKFCAKGFKADCERIENFLKRIYLKSSTTGGVEQFNRALTKK